MSGVRRYVISIAIVLLLAGALVGASFALDLKPRLGLDLRGGLSVTLTAPEGTRDDVLDQTVEILRARVDRAGVAEPEISREGSNNISVQLPGNDDPQRLLDLIGRTAQLQFRQVLEVISQGMPNYETTPVSTDDDPKVEVVYLSSEDNDKLRLGPAELTGGDVRDGAAVADPNTGGWSIDLRFKAAGSRKWEEFTGRLACLQGAQRQVAIALDGIVESAPQIAEEVVCNQGITGGTTSITGDFTQDEAKDLGLVLTTGALPVKLEQSEVRTVSPTLGRDSLRAGVLAGALGLALVMLYVLVYYRALGLQTWVGLLVFAAVTYGLIVVFGRAIGWNLTLSGIAGLIVSIGVATDSYVVFFERVKEEVHAGKTLRSSMDRGFSQAWKTLRAANGVTIMAAIVLYVLAVGPVRGFALALGTATTLDLALFASLTWPLAALLARSNFFAENRFIGMRGALEGKKGREGSRLSRIMRSEFDFDFVGRARLWLIVSAILIAITVAALIPGIRGLTFGIDFKGGAVFRTAVDRDVTVAEVRRALGDVGETDTVVQILREPRSERRLLQVQTPVLESEGQAKVQQAVASVAGVETSAIDFERVGEKWGRQITSKAVRGLLIFLVLVLIYMSIRLEPKMALAGFAALLHDLVVTAGIYAIVGFQVTPASIIALLTILGYSLYDTVVVFDKIRENAGLPINARRAFPEIANQSMNQVLMRSLNTSFMVLIPVGSLLFVGSALLGAETLKDLALALFVGVAASTYSSIFVATPLLSFLKKGEARYSTARARAVKEATAARREVPATDGAGDGARVVEELDDEYLVTAPTRVAPRGAPPGSATQQKAGQRKKASRKKRKKGRR